MSLADRTYELVSFLVDVLGVGHLRHRHVGGPVTYHDGCSGLRELGIKAQPRKLLRAIGAPVCEMADAEVCCGFGGTFCVKYPDISTRMVSDKVRNIVATEAETVTAGDLGCLLNIAGRLQREDHQVDVRHVAELLAGISKDVPPIGQGSR
jgi:L-lactate dehydrogenase complex protein LldE